MENKGKELKTLNVDLENQKEKSKTKMRELKSLIEKQEIIKSEGEVFISSQKAQKNFMEDAGCKDGDVYGVDCGIKLEPVELKIQKEDGLKSNKLVNA